MSVQALNRKEAIASGEDIAPVTREEYYLKELAEGQGGGGLDYVIPEQTVTTASNPVSITSNQLVVNQTYILKYIDESSTRYIPAKSAASPINPNNIAIFFELGEDTYGAFLAVDQIGDDTTLALYDTNMEIITQSHVITISVIQGF